MYFEMCDDASFFLRIGFGTISLYRTNMFCGRHASTDALKCHLKCNLAQTKHLDFNGEHKHILKSLLHLQDEELQRKQCFKGHY